MFCKGGGGKPKLLDYFAGLQNKMHYLNDVQDLCGGGGQTNVCGVFGDEMQVHGLMTGSATVNLSWAYSGFNSTSLLFGTGCLDGLGSLSGSAF